MKTLRIFLFVLIVIGVILLCTQKLWVPGLVGMILSSEDTPLDTVIQAQKTVNPVISISITTKKIKEENFTGTVPVIAGTSTLAVNMKKYLEATVAEFRTQANADVPPMRAKFGADNPTANYEIEIDSKYIKSEKTESIVTNVYTYTGGAHGGTVYHVLSADRASGKILSLSNIIKQAEQNAFTEFVKKRLDAWIPEGSDAPVVFPDDVASLKFADFSNWSLDDKNLTIYFDQYMVGPGVLGAVVFPLSLSQIRNFLQ